MNGSCCSNNISDIHLTMVIINNTNLFQSPLAEHPRACLHLDMFQTVPDTSSYVKVRHQRLFQQVMWEEPQRSSSFEKLNFNSSIIWEH